MRHIAGSCSVFLVWESFLQHLLTWHRSWKWDVQDQRMLLPSMSVSRSLTHTCAQTHADKDAEPHCLLWSQDLCNKFLGSFLCSFSFRFVGLTSPPQPRLMRLYHREGSSAVGRGCVGYMTQSTPDWGWGARGVGGFQNTLLYTNVNR